METENEKLIRILKRNTWEDALRNANAAIAKLEHDTGILALMQAYEAALWECGWRVEELNAAERAADDSLLRVVKQVKGKV